MEKEKDMGASVGPGSREPSRSVSALSGFDPSRDERQEHLRQMVALDEQLEAEHPGWMTGAPVVPDADAIMEEVGIRMHPKLEAVVHQYCDEAYAVIMESVQDYLRQNVAFNIGSEIESLERTIDTLRREIRDIDKALDYAGNPRQSRADTIRSIRERHGYTNDSVRLDWLDEVNANSNERVGSDYGWKYDINHNRAALTDCNFPKLTIRQAIDEAMGQRAPRDSDQNPEGGDSEAAPSRSDAGAGPKDIAQ